MADDKYKKVSVSSLMDSGSAPSPPADKSTGKVSVSSLIDDEPVKKKATHGGDPSASPSPNGTSPSQGSAEVAAGNAGQPAPVSLKGDGPAPLAAVPPQAAQMQPAADPDVPVGTTQSPRRSLAPDQSVPSAGVQPTDGDYFIGGDLGAALRAMDAASGLGLGKMTDGFTRAVVAGQTQNENVDEALSLLLMPKGRSDEDLQAFIESTRIAQSMPPSKAMQEYERVYKEEGEDAWAFFKAIAQNPKVAPEVMIQSISSMFNKESMAAAGTVIGTATAFGAVAGEGIGAIPAAIGSLPYAMAAAGTVLETTASFTEFIQDELAKRGQTLTKDNLRALLEDDDVMNTIRAKAAARGLVIGAVDGVGSKLAGAVGAKFIRKAMPVRGTLAASGIEAAGGSGGEAAARAVTGQPMDASQIGLEGIAEVVQAPVSILSAMNSDGIKVRMEEVKGLQDAKDKYAKVTGQPVYKINGEAVTKDAMMDIVRSSGLKELQGINFEVANDEDVSGFITDRMAELVMQEKVSQANPGLPPETAAQVTELEKEVAALKGNPTESAKVKVARAKQKIREIVEQPTDEAQQSSQTPPDQSNTERTLPGTEVAPSDNIAPERVGMAQPVTPVAAETTKTLYRATGMPTEKAGSDFEFYGSKSTADEYSAMWDNSTVESKKVSYSNPLEVTLEREQFSDPKFEKPYLEQAKRDGNDAVIFTQKGTGKKHYAIRTSPAPTVPQQSSQPAPDQSDTERTQSVTEQPAQEQSAPDRVDVKPYDERTDAEHATYIRDKFTQEFTGRGVPEEQVQGALALLDARAKVSNPDNPDAYYRKIQDIGSGQFQDNTPRQYQMPDGTKVMGMPVEPEVVNGFYSPIEKRIGEFRGDKQSATKWLTGGFIGKGDEATYTGVKQWLESKRPDEAVSKQDILDFMKQNRVEIVEVVKGGEVSEADIDAFLNDEMGEGYTREEAREYLSNDENNSQPKYSQYQLPGESTNYREVLVTMPTSKKSYVVKEAGDYYPLFKSNSYEEALDWKNENTTDGVVLENEDASGTFKSPHFDEPNILVHLRMNERTGSDGKKVLFVEEVQSDFGQSFKKQQDKMSSFIDKNTNELIEMLKQSGRLKVIC